MKNFYLVILAIFTLIFSGHSQIIEDDFEFYVLGDMGIQNPSVWSVWNGDPEAGGGIIVAEGNGGQIGYIGPNSFQDALLLLGNQSSGDYIIYFDMFITASSTGYFNIQGETETNAVTGFEGAGAGGAGVFNSGNIYFNNGGAAPGVVEDQTTGETGTYPEDAWFSVELYFDVDALTYVMTVDGTDVNAAPVPFQADAILGAIDFFSINSNNNYFIDNVVFDIGIIDGIDDFSAANFKLYPNPVTNVLNIQSAVVVSGVEVYTILGKRVLEVSPNAISPRIDTSGLSSGVYLVQVTIDHTSKTFKAVK